MALFSEALLRLRQDLDESRQNRCELIRGIRAEVREMARQTGSRLAEQGKTRRAEFAAMMHGLRGTLRQQADQTRGQLAELAADLRHGGEVFGGRPSPKRGSRNR
jgi:DNA anti-recombination protein RmuC